MFTTICNMLVAYGAIQSHSQDPAQLVIACNMVVQATESWLGGWE